MKRLVWLLLLAVGTALAQVSPVEVRLSADQSCPCCDQPGACGMPDCAPAPAAPTLVALPTASQTAVRTAKRAVPAPTGARHHFSGQVLTFSPAARLRPADRVTTSAASVSAYRMHCSPLL